LTPCLMSSFRDFRSQARQQPVAQAGCGEKSFKTLLRQARASGSLSLSNRDLSGIPPEVLLITESLDQDEKVWECLDLVKLDLSHNSIAALPADIDRLAPLRQLILSNNRITTVVPECFHLESLVMLDLSKNSLAGGFPAELGQLRCLLDLSVANNQLTSLPDSLCDLTSLEHLRLDHNRLVSLPTHLGRLGRLVTLSAASNALSHLPPALNLRALRTLDASCNKLALPGPDGAVWSLSALSSLTALDLHQNQLRNLPALPAGAPVVSIKLGANRLSTLSSPGGAATGATGPDGMLLSVRATLAVLELCDNSLHELPAAVVLLDRVKTLDLTNNDLSDLPIGLGYVRSLTSLQLGGNPLRSIRRALVDGPVRRLSRLAALF
jgi:Leucine-rich repeat (LRR) protein